jgi:cysteinyl-tRNA synthetase
MDFSFEALSSAKKRLVHLRQYCAKLLYNQQKYDDDLARRVKIDFNKALENNLNSNEAIVALSLLQSNNSLSSQSLEIFKIAENIFNLGLIPKLIPFSKSEEKIIASRNAARKSRAFREADNLRGELKKLSIECEDLEDRSLYWRF